MYCLKQHKVATYEGVRYSCDICNILPFTFRSSLRQHKASVYEGIRYWCDQCNAFIDT